MIDASNVFQVFASFLSKLGIFICLPIGIGLFIFATKKQFETENAKRKVMDFVKMALLLFAALQLPTILVWMLFKGR